MREASLNAAEVVEEIQPGSCGDKSKRSRTSVSWELGTEGKGLSVVKGKLRMRDVCVARPVLASPDQGGLG